MIKEIEIQGCVTVPEEVSIDDFIDKFIAFIEENRWNFKQVKNANAIVDTMSAKIMKKYALGI